MVYIYRTDFSSYLIQTGKLVRVKNFWDFTKEPSWWPQGVPFESPGKRGI